MDKGERVRSMFRHGQQPRRAYHSALALERRRDARVKRPGAGAVPSVQDHAPGGPGRALHAAGSAILPHRGGQQVQGGGVRGPGDLHDVAGAGNAVPTPVQRQRDGDRSGWRRDRRRPATAA